MATSKLGAVLVSIAAALFWFVYKGWFELGIFSQMTPEQTFQAFVWSSLLATTLVIVSIIGHVSSKKASPKSISASDNSIAVDNSGSNNSIKIRK